VQTSDETPDLLLRPASEADVRLLRKWRNDPEVRAASRNIAEVGDEEHAAWLEEVLADPYRHLLICEFDGAAVGQVRFDRRGEGRYEISIVLAAEARGRGLSAHLISAAVEWLRTSFPGSEVEAHVREANARSLSTFRRAGFCRAGEAGDGFLVLLAPIDGADATPAG
jgi:RimJ/RimL family protein N-acetyltransferase